ncbi:MAG: hypothetical protein IPK16_08720 [Anaerolineales bacterium]|nr:hypothetical protein [Anaerolineales bacterium]
MRAKIGYGATDTLDDAMTQTVKLYATLKDNCVTFDNEIKPGTVDLANDIVQYQRIADTVYDRLGQAIDAYDIAGVETAEITDKLKALAGEWAKDTPSEAATKVKDRFKAYVQRLYDEADTRSKRATALNDKLIAFAKSLTQSQADFTQMRDVTLKGKYDAEDEEVKKAKQKVKDKQDELETMQKKKDDETIVLETAPLYLLIPAFGPFIMAGVLIGVGVDFAKTKEEVEGLQAQLEKLEAAQAAHQKFLGGIDTAKGLTDKTANDIKTVQPLVAKLAGAWNALASDLESLVKPNEGVLTKAKLEAKDEDWLMSSLDLGTARTTWKDLKDAADKYRQFAFLTPWN